MAVLRAGKASVSSVTLRVVMAVVVMFNKYQMSTPSYRETKNRLADMNWDTCRQNLSNRADKGAVQLNKLIPALNLQAGSDVNVDETWERYPTHKESRYCHLLL